MTSLMPFGISLRKGTSNSTFMEAERQSESGDDFHTTGMMAGLKDGSCHVFSIMVSHGTLTSQCLESPREVK